MNHLHREVAPISEAGWKALEEEVTPRLTTHLAARKLVDFDGPHGWRHSATNLGRAAAIGSPAEGVVAAQRRVLPLVELRAEFKVRRAELQDAERGASDLDFSELAEAARRMALAENTSVFYGYPAAAVRGIAECSTHSPIPLAAEAHSYPNSVARAVDLLRQAGIGGPYGLAIGPSNYTRIVETTEHGGYPLLDHLRQILGGPVVWAPGVEGGILLSLRGGDFVLESGQDISLGYLDHDAEVVHLYLEESFSFRVLEPEAAVVLQVGA
jgi:uncharacterized linocin/CFP29 family protein